jgi:hypothetical protein
LKISQLTRRDLIDAIAAERLDWSGRLEESEFLSRIYDLESLPSTDGRFKDAAGDIWQHRVNNFDWDEDWVFYDSRFGLMNGDDEIFLRFLCETWGATMSTSGVPTFILAGSDESEAA